MSALSEYTFTCECGRPIASHEPEALCPNCHRLITVEWHPQEVKHVHSDR